MYFPLSETEENGAKTYVNICVKIFPLEILVSAQLANILSMIFVELFEILVGWNMQGRKLIERKVFMKLNVGVYES